MSIAPFVPADLILDPNHIPLFLKWQGPHIESDHKGMIRNAEEYYQFLQSLGSESGSPIQPIGKTLPATLSAVRCGHELHPSVHLPAHYCPVCEVRMSLTFLDATAMALQKVGGPWHTRSSRNVKLPILRGCWHMARLHLQELVESLEVSARFEYEWETQNPNQAPVARRMNTATHAVRMAIMEHKYPAVISESHQNGKKRKAADMDDYPLDQVKNKKKKVTFAPGTDFEPGRDSSVYCRESNRYEPGNHACEDSQGWLNTSQFGLNHPDFCNLKLFSTNSRAEFDSLDNNISGGTGQYQGLLSQHSSFEAISTFVAADTLELELDADTLAEMIELSDAITVLFNYDGTVLDFCLSQSADIEDIDEEEEVVDQNRWTCLRDIGFVNESKNHAVEHSEKVNPQKRLVNKLRKIHLSKVS